MLLATLLATLLAALLAAPALAFHGEEVALECVPCNTTEFCHAGLRTRCPAHSLSDFSAGAATDIDDCVCVPGYLREEAACNLGEAPYWYFEGVLQTCAEFPRRVTVANGAWRAEQCVCVPGYSEFEAEFEAAPGVCAKCPADSYNSQHNASCVRCPAHSSHLEQARTTITACTCDAGFSGLDGGPCVACAAGTFKAANGSAACETCAADTYSNGTASAACVACHGNSTAAAGSAVVADCRCDPGFELVDGRCVQCAAGKFKGASGNEACELCAEGEFAGAAGATACVACNAHSDAEAARGRCLCNAGFVQESAAALHPTCTACAADTYQNLTGQTACVDCDAHAQAGESSTDIGACVCNAGYRDVEYGGCVACLPGEYKEAVDETAACADCPANSHSPPASPVAEACLCNAGFEGPDGGSCTDCESGKFKAGNGSTPCEFCTANTFADTEAATACTQCFEHGLSPVGSTDLSACVCDIFNGFVEIGVDGERACSACAPGTYADDSVPNAGCANCSYGTYTNIHGKTACDTCPLNTSTYNYPQTECECDPGYRCDAQLVAQCVAQSDIALLNANPWVASELFRVRVVCTANISYTNLLIMNQPPGQYYGRTWLDNLITDVEGGYLGFRHVPEPDEWAYNGGVAIHDWASGRWIHAYTRMHWEETTSNMALINSALSGKLIDVSSTKFVMLGIRFRLFHNPWIEHVNSQQTIFSWTYLPYFYGLTARAMLVNGQLKIRFGAGSWTLISGQFDQWVSVFAQFYGGNVHIRVVWEDGTPTQHLTLEINAAAGDPVYGQAYLLGLGSVATTDELLAFGAQTMWLDNTASFDVSHFFIDYACTDTTLLDTISFKKECEEPSGEAAGCGDCDGHCEACDADTFKPTAGYAVSCTPCQVNAHSPPLSTDPSHCLCNAGYFHEQDYTSPPPFTCASCAAGEYTDLVGADRCIACPANYFTPVERHPWDAAGDCDACALCPAHEYDAARGGLGCGLDVPTACAACPANAGTWRNDSLAERNANATACACNAGYYGPLGGPCALCPAGFVKTQRIGRDTTIDDCVQCPSDTYMARQDTACRACLAHSTSPAGSFEKQHCACDAGRENEDPEIRAAFEAWGDELSAQDLPVEFVGAFEDGGLTVCRRCARGDHKPAAGNQRCDACAADTFQNATGMTYCAACPANTSSAAAATECYCDPSFENVDGEHHDCTLCRPASYKTASGNQVCTACDACAADEQVATECAPGANITCKACQAHAWNPAGSTRRGPCLCNAGYELASDAQYGYACEACAVGEYRTTDLNNSVPCRTCGPLTFTTQPATVACEACTLACDDTRDTSTEAYYVSVECTPSTDIVCARCTVCPAGAYANATCGVAFNNDRSDTTCDRCPAGAYCPGNGTQPQACPAHSTSPPASVLAESCQCHPGYYQTDVHLYGAEAGLPIFDSLGLPSHQCFACDADTYCTGDGTVTQCPAHSFTWHTASAHRLDCQCFPGYYRAGDKATFDTAFDCALCTPNDYCFNNSRYNCSDERMLSEAGSAFFANCTCMAGYYNNGTRCEACHVDTYCVGDGLPRACPAHEWTSGERAYSECYCQPGYHSPALPPASPKGCELCPVGSFCPGEYDARWNCTAHSTAAAGSAVDVDCKCLPGFGNVSLHALLPDDTPTFHACAACADGLFKETTANAACEPCSVCLPDPDGVYELQACRADYDARCGPCDPCTNGSIWTSQACALKLDAVCSPCTVCEYAREFLDEVCTPQQNAVCRNISYGLACPVGEYAGGHTERTDSVCAPCAYRDRAYFGQRLHEAASPGKQYNDAYSCEIRCLGLSRMVSVHNHSLGCVSCETGNVLLREFSVVPDADGRAAECAFVCRAGFEFDAARNDCFAPVLRASTRNTFTHSLHVSNWGRTAAGFLFTVTHSNHSRFVVVAGRATPTSCRHDECCFGQLWRVSSLAQLGLPLWAAENCSRTPALLHSTVHADTLEFEVPDTRLAEVASCAWAGNATQECTLVVSLVDTVLRRSYSQTVVLRTRRAMTLALLNGAHVYVPLDAIRVDLLLAAREPGTAVYLVVTQMRSARGEQNVTLRVPGMTPVTTQCPHYSFPADTEFPAAPTVTVGTDRLYSFAAFWRGADNLDVVRLFYALRRGNDIMDVAAVRNVSQLEPVCTPHRRTSVVQLGFVDAAAGLGAHVVEAMHRLHAAAEPTRTTRGELGSLVTFVAEAYSPDVTDIRVKTVLAAHTSAAVALAVMQNATAYEAGALDFRYGFRQWCRAPDVPVKCVYEYLHLDSRGRTMHVVACSDAGRAAARAWLQATFGAVHDGGHVDALCARVAAARHRAAGVLVNTLAYVARDSVWNAYHNASRPATETFVWPDMQFVAP